MALLRLHDLKDSMLEMYHNTSSYFSWNTLALYGGVIGGTWIAYKAFIEPFLSPLRQIPGTTFNPFWGNMKEIMKGEAMEATIKMMKEHGTLCRYYFMFGRERLMVADPDIMKHILVTNCKNYIKPPSRLRLMRMIFGNGLVMSEGSIHASHKRFLSPSFNNNSIKKMISVFVKRSKKLVDEWTKQIEKDSSEQYAEIDAQATLSNTTLDIIGEIAFGYDFNSLENPDLEVTQAFQRILTGIGLSWRYALPFYHLLPFPDVKRFKSDVFQMHKAVQEVIQHKKNLLEQGADVQEVTNDVLGQMLLAQDEDGQGLTEKELQDEVITLMLAGFETTSTCLSWCLLLLAQNPAIQDKAREEVLRVLPSNINDITWNHIEELSYCSCVIKETLRLCPPLPLTLRQSLKNDYLGSKSTSQYFVPEHTIILLAIGPMMRRDDLFDSASEFIPERFLNREVDDGFYRFLPFLIGPRMCLGYKFANMEMRVVLALLLYNFVFKTVPGIHFLRQSRITMRPSPPLKLLVKKV
ncbi:hypothetical protein LSH36_12g13076 [Paralvinella palmiformis]|uniref:Cytochrome P450 n=1 Tax=Paralvinella palmiformis TaxID=53620 RepID=A0AAD9NHU1_9ANNE|nr:hypothetical protein LSH36_12g13076 [Paralvinella palmiformis]